MTSMKSNTFALAKAEQWLAQGLNVLFFTVVKTYGSSPRPVGSILSVNENGFFSGSVSAGCVDDELIRNISSYINDYKKPYLISFGGSSEENKAYELPCNGTIQILVESMSIGTVRAILYAIRNEEVIIKQTNLLYPETLISKINDVRDIELTENTCRHRISPPDKIIIIGANDLAEVVVTLAVNIGYDVIVCDPRSRYIANWDAHDVKVKNTMPDELIHSLLISESSVILALSHDQRLDDLTIIEALGTNSGYIGALGSMTTCENRLQRLKKRGVSTDSLNRIVAPVGLPIGSKTPWEIGVSIMADIIARRQNKIIKF